MANLLNKILLILYVIATLLTLYVFFARFKYIKPQLKETKARKQFLEEGKRVQVPKAIRIKKLIVNLPSRSEKLRFLELSADIIPFKEANLAVLNEQSFILRDIIIDLARKMPQEELNSVMGKLLLENRIIKRVNNFYQGKAIKEIYFLKFLIR
jgi:flagellar FliL protein